MSKPLICVITVGAAVGFMLPTGQSSTPAAAPAANAAGQPVPVESRVRRAPNGHFYVHATVNGELVRFLVDTGATTVALTEEDAERVGIVLNRSEYREIGRSAAGTVQGQLASIDSIEIEGKRVSNVRGAVLEGSEVSLLGQSYLSRIRAVEMSGDYMVLR